MNASKATFPVKQSLYAYSAFHCLFVLQLVYDQLFILIECLSFAITSLSVIQVIQLRKACSHPYLFPGIEPEPYEEGEHLVQVSLILIW